MSDVFFEQLQIPRPSYLLNINGGGHGHMTGKMLIDIESVLQNEKPDCVLVYGDTNSTLAGAIAASKLHIPIAHIESGLRSFNMNMPEEVNRVLTDRISSFLFCPTETSILNLKNEGYPFKTQSLKYQIVEKVGDVMQDSTILFSQQSMKPQGLYINSDFLLATVHRAENTDNLDRLSNILDALNSISRQIPVILPLHPRTKNIIKTHNLDVSNIQIIDPIGYLEMLWLLEHCSLVITDSGGIQKEAYFMGKVCATMRDETEWTELVDIGVNHLVGAHKDKIFEIVKNNIGRNVIDDGQLYGGGEASHKIVSSLKNSL